MAQAKKTTKECQICCKEVANISFARHMKIHKERKSFKCEYCQKEFTRNEGLTEHLRIHTGEKPFKCELCGKTFTQSSNLSSHMKNHNETKKKECQICGKEVKHLSHHMKVHIHAGQPELSIET